MRSSRKQNILKGLKQVGKTAKNVAVPAITKGVSVVYNTMATGVEQGATLLTKQSRGRRGRGSRRTRGRGRGRGRGSRKH